MPQPLAWVIGTTPSTFGYSSSIPDRSAAWAISRATVAEQFTEVRMPR